MKTTNRAMLRILTILACIFAVGCSSASSSPTSKSDSLVASSNSISESIGESVSDSNSSDNNNTSSLSEDEGETYRAIYYHVFKQADFKQAGGTTQNINGLTWNYSAFAFLGGSNDGVQLGSKNNSQQTPWTMTTSFPGIVAIKDVLVEVKTASGGSAKVAISGKDFEASPVSFSNTTLQEFDVIEEEFPTDSFSLTLQSETKAAMYFYSLTIIIDVPKELDLDIYEDQIEGEPIVPGVNNIPMPTYTSISKESYYSSINFSQSGSGLLTDLRTLLTGMTKTSYSDAKYMLQYTDESITNPGFDYGMWDGDLIKATWDSGASWNREHVWACAQMQITSQARPNEDTRNHSTDLHNLRVACQQANGLHGNKFFDYFNTTTTMYPNIADGLSGHHAYGGDFRGDLARTLFYMYVRYEGLQLNDDLDINNNVSMGKLSALLDWHALDPVDAFETQRNNRIYGYQGNRNPFIDYPEIVAIIF